MARNHVIMCAISRTYHLWQCDFNGRAEK